MTFAERQARIADLQVIRDEANAEIMDLLKEATIMDEVTGTPAERAVERLLDDRREGRRDARRAARAVSTGKDGGK
jgi:hypothetical protein